MTQYEIDKLRSILADPHVAVDDGSDRCVLISQWLDEVEPENILDEINAECARQLNIWGGKAHDDRHGPYDWTRFIVRYVAKANDAIEEKQAREWRGRVVQIAALAVSAIRSFDRKSKKRG